MKGLILAGGSGTRLHPITIPTSKQLLPVYDKPMVYYPLCNLMQANIREVLLITTQESLDQYMQLLKDGSQWGMSIHYSVQEEPNGIAEAFLIGQEFIGEDSSVLILGDNLFHGKNLTNLINMAIKREEGATIFACEVDDPERFGVITFDENKQVKSIEEKPKSPISNFAVPGFYFYDNKVVDFVENIKPSNRGELEIQDINLQYLERDELFVEVFDETIDWIDAGTFDSLLEASSHIKDKQLLEDNIIGSPEMQAWKNKWISDQELAFYAENLSKNTYGRNLLRAINKN
tara:strand:- start:1646 stop:2515 length:870 start_codon:yes stop_codon:yes gene_type:complete